MLGEAPESRGISRRLARPHQWIPQRRPSTPLSVTPRRMLPAADAVGRGPGAARTQVLDRAARRKGRALYADAIVRAISGAKDLRRGAVGECHWHPHTSAKEIERASSKKRPIIALRIDAAALTPALEYFLSESQWIEAPVGIIGGRILQLIDAIREPEQTGPGIIPAATRDASAGTAYGGSRKRDSERREGLDRVKRHKVVEWTWGTCLWIRFAAGRALLRETFECLDQVATLAPGSADAQRGEAFLSLALGHWDNALRQVKASLAQDPLRVRQLLRFG